MESIKLNKANLIKVNKGVKLPLYTGKDLIPSIVHIGVGHFHRAHQAFFLDELLNRGLCREGIFGINLVPDSLSQGNMRLPLGDALKEQDFLYTLITKDPDGRSDLKIIASIIGYMNAIENKVKAIIRVADEKVSLITLTVTEGGYFYDKESGKPNIKEEFVQWDLKNPENPKSAPAFLASVLKRRYDENKKPLTIMCCDNLPENGKVLESCVQFFCQEHFPEILSWVEDNISFPSSMVDRIVPGTTGALIKELEERTNINDNWPVCGEDYIQWVLEDNFRTTIPDYAACGVQIVKNVEPYELMKMRLLNGSHSAMAYISYLLGCHLVNEAIGFPLINSFIRNHYMEEVSPTLELVPSMDIEVYKNTLIRRFSNSNISDTILRLCFNGSTKIPNFILKPLSELVHRGLPHSAIVFALSAWARFLSGKDEEGKDIPIDDVNIQVMSSVARNAQKDPRSFLISAGLQKLGEAQLISVADIFKKHLDSIYQKGIRASLEEFLKT